MNKYYEQVSPATIRYKIHTICVLVSIALYKLNPISTPTALTMRSVPVGAGAIRFPDLPPAYLKTAQHLHIEI